MTNNRKYNDSPTNYIYSYRGHKLHIKSTDIDCCIGTCAGDPNIYLVHNEEAVKHRFRQIIRKRERLRNSRPTLKN